MDCIFCKIAKKTLPSYLVYEDEEFLAFLDAFPASFGHVVLIPKKHIENFYDLPIDLSEKILPVAQKIALAMKKTLGIEGLNILQNNGITAGQTVFHYHLHIIPRRENDHITMAWEQKAPTQDEFEKIRNQLKKEVQ